MMRGFTLVEVLIVITIIVVLAAISFSTAKHLRRSASSSVCVSKMNQIGNAILIYTQDHAGRMPPRPSLGIIFVGQGPWYNRDGRRLQNILGEYLGSRESTTWSTNVTLMSYDDTFAWPALLASGKKGCASVLLNNSVSIRTADAVSLKNPWDGVTGSPTVGWVLDNIEDASHQAVFVEVDQKNTNAGWKDNVPRVPIHGTYRNSLFFDWHVAPVQVTP